MKHLVLFMLLFLSFVAAQAQSRPDSIYMKKGLSPAFYQNGMRIMPRDLDAATRLNPEANAEMRKARTNNSVASVLGGIGGFFIGMPLGTAMGGGEPQWALAGVGAGFIAASVPFSIGFTKRAKNAIRIYNKGGQPTGMQKVDYRFGAAGNGYGLKMTF